MSNVNKLPDGWIKKHIFDIAPIESKLVDPKLEEYSNLMLIAPDHVQQKTGCLIERKSAHEQSAISWKFLVQKGDIIYSKIRPYLMKAAIAPESCLCSADMYPLRCNELVDARYLLATLLSDKFTNFAKSCSARTGIPKLNREDMAEFLLNLPPMPEQKAIADLLATWDEAIEKTDHLIKTKELRFGQLLKDAIHQGRKDHAWKGYNIGDICEPVSRKNVENNTNVLTSSAQNGLISQVEYYNKSVSAEDVTGYILLNKGEFAYNRSSSKGYPYGATKRLDRYEKGVLSTLYLCFAIKPDAPCESDFLLHLFESGIVNRELRSVCQEGARSHGLLNITKSDFFGIKLFLPSVDKQKEIQMILNKAKEEIALLRELSEKYKRQKRGLMQKLLTGTWRIKPEVIDNV